ncbi:MAG: secondary thiamine-phosphate synthase enzyme YjbQ [Ignavibacteriales bacterium]|nr:secondary thiamine-phosphate synthase enzyme YjbQ [Ignavibacteriales bacterium]
MTIQKEIILRSRPRGFHLITEEIVSQLDGLDKFCSGIMHIFIKHTSASLTINENADPTVRKDMEAFFNKIVPENETYFEHTLEGTDDMTSHLKSSILGSSITLPITQGKLNLGTWQGIYLCEHRNLGHSRKIVVTIIGD